MKRFYYHQPETIVDALKMMEKVKGEGLYIAGGTDLIVKLKQGVISPGALISLRQVHALRGIKKNGDLVLGSMTLFRDIERDGDILTNYPCLSEAASLLANPQIRNVATIGGNLCNAAPSADSAPPLMVLEAEVLLEGPGGTRVVSIEELFTGPGTTCLDPLEILTEIRLPAPDSNSGNAFVKLGRLKQDIAVVNAAAMVTMEGAVCKRCRVAVGAVAPTPLRLKQVEKMVEDNSIDEDLLESVQSKVKELVSPITDVRSTAQYRREVSGVLVKRALKKAISRVHG